MKERGLLFHAKHAYMPNSLGYCGPDDRGSILRHLEGADGGEELTKTLTQFEAAYPFLRLIARSTGREVFDYSVPEAYWIGNGLLDRVPVPEFYEFSHKELNGRDPKEVRRVFRALGRAARPHHSFYVLSTYASSSVKDGPSLSNLAARKVGEAMDNCRISWGAVTKVGAKSLQVRHTPVAVDRGRVRLGRERLRTVLYNREVTPFAEVRRGDVVSMHWNYACEVLTPRQVRNISKYTQRDLDSVNSFLAAGE